MDIYKDKGIKTPNIKDEISQKNNMIRNATIWIELNVEPLEEKVQKTSPEWMRTANRECCVDINSRDAVVWKAQMKRW